MRYTGSIILLCLLMIACKTNPSSTLLSEEDIPQVVEESQPIDPEIILREQAQKIVNTMSLDEKIGQFFILAIRHTAYGQPALEVDDYVADFVNKYKPSGIILFSINLDNAEQTKKLIEDLQSSSNYPLFMATDEEGGAVSRLGKNPKMEVVSLPSPVTLGKQNSDELIYNTHSVLAMDMTSLGFNLDMAPVADLSRGYIALGGRGFSNNPEQTAKMVAEAVAAFEDNHLGSVLKHFPGLGNSTGDTHNSAVISPVDKKTFYEEDFLPFQEGINEGADFVLLSHMIVPSLDPLKIPSTLSYEIQTNILRNTLGFEGLIVTDAMDMGAIVNHYSAGEAALLSYRAGTDIILMPSHIPGAQKAIKEAYLDGTLDHSDFEERLIRITLKKMELGLYSDSQYGKNIDVEKRAELFESIKNYVN